MQLALSEPVPLLPGAAARIENVTQLAADPIPERYLHFHGPAELVILTKGEGMFYCDDMHMPFRAGMCVYAPSMSVHDFAFAPGDRAWTLVQFDPHAIDREIVALPSAAFGISPDKIQFDRIAMLAHWLAQTIANAEPPRTFVLQLRALMLAVVQSYGTKVGVVPQAQTSLLRFRPLTERMASDLSLMLSVNEAASICAMSPAYFSRCFKQAFGTAFGAYQTQVKLQQAARMLATCDQPVAQIGFCLGFRSHAYFTHRFTTMFGLSPSAYRKKV